ncbi:glycosyltransferase family 4 protein [Roseivivax isoporae]|uniref:glycosyltransferase family 4 protein n=1 Tax=Roseivivax isoporae TaxID=591206 RepID=UPI0004B2390B|nr:glycosyltransferase family 4 protein [Roseivivax isoporae]
MRSRPADPPIIRHHVAGGTEQGGGIGRLVEHVVVSRETTLAHRAVDTRGPRFHPVGSILPFARAIRTIVADALNPRPTLQHLHVAGRGSTVRKTVLATVARIVGQPYVLHLHDYDYASDLDRRPRWQRAAVASAFRNAAAVIALGRRDAATLADRLGVAPERLTVLRNCVPVPPETAPATSGATARILFLGTLGARKGVPELVAALAHPAMRTQTWRATLAGDGAVDQFRAEVARRGLADRVRLPGWVGSEETARLRADADILVLPSHAEGFAMAVIEGLAHGLAVVTTRVGAHDEVLVDGENCLLVAPGDVDGLAGALARLAGDPALRQRLGEAGRALYARHFRLSPYLRDLERLHREALTDASAQTRSA